MLELSFRINGLDRIRSIFSRIIGNDPIVEAFERNVNPLFQEFKAYEAPQKQSYQRTFSLMNSWKYEIQRNFSSVGLKISSDNKAAPFVRGQRTQAWMHQGRWNTDEQIAQRHIGAISESIENAYSRRMN